MSSVSNVVFSVETEGVSHAIPKEGVPSGSWLCALGHIVTSQHAVTPIGTEK